MPFVAGIRLVFILQFSSHSDDYFLRYVYIPLVSLLPFLVEPLVEQESQYVKLAFRADHGEATGCCFHLASKMTGGCKSCSGLAIIPCTIYPVIVVGAGNGLHLSAAFPFLRLLPGTDKVMLLSSPALVGILPLLS